MLIEKIVAALINGKDVTYCGNAVRLEGKYDWQERSLWVEHENGSSYRAGFREIRAMRVAD